MPNTDLCSAKEKSEVHIIVERSLAKLSDDDKKLPQIVRMRNLLRQGIGVHHGGLLPIVKEMIEILFSRGLVKVLFATETFAMGVNMPARTVVFSSTQKHDGRSFRDLLPGEYTQMAGRAGRRGLDNTGVVVIVCDEQPPDTHTLHKMILGQPTKLISQFRLTYNMILNLLRVEVLRVEELIRRSFSENAQQRLLPEEQKKVEVAEKQLSALKLPDDSETISELRLYHQASCELIDLNCEILDTLLSFSSGSQFFASGRIVVLKDKHFRDNLAVILKAAHSARGLPSARLVDTQSYFVLAFVPPSVRNPVNDIPADSVLPLWPPQIAPAADEITYELAVVPCSSIAMVTKRVLRVNASAIADFHQKTQMVEALEKFLSLKLLDEMAKTSKYKILDEYELQPVKLRTMKFRDLLHQRASKLIELEKLSSVEKINNFEEKYLAVHTESLIKQKLARLHASLSEENLELLPDYQARVGVLRELKYIDNGISVSLKGRVACEINSSHELILTEVILENVMAAYDAAETAALLSALVFQEKTEIEPVLTPSLREGCERLTQIADRVEAVCLRHNVAEDASTHARGRGPLNFGLVEVVWRWAQGMPFAELTSLTDIQEGTIVRTMTRLDESCRELRDAARVIGDLSLGKKVEACQELIRRDVIFASSLYI